MTTIRVLRVIARMNVGGPALQVVALADGLDPGRFEQRLLVGSVGADEGDYLTLRAPHVEATTVPGLGRSPDPLGDARALGTVAAEIKRFRPHVVHTHTAKAGAIGRVAARARRAPATVHTFHGHLLDAYFSSWVTRGVVGVERTLARITTRLVAVGERVRDDLIEAGIGRREQYAVIPPGVEVESVPRREARERLGLPADAPVVVFVARLTSVKRPDRFVEVASRVAEQVADAVFVVAGEGELFEETRHAAAPLGNRVRFLGWRSDVETIYGAADVVVLTSDNEGMPVSLIEAAAAGRAAVTTDVGSAAEVVIDGETGIVVGRDADRLAEAVVTVLTEPGRRDRFGEAAAVHAAQRFGRRRLVDDYAALYEELALEKEFA